MKIEFSEIKIKHGSQTLSLTYQEAKQLRDLLLSKIPLESNFPFPDVGTRFAVSNLAGERVGEIEEEVE